MPELINVQGRFVILRGTWKEEAFLYRLAKHIGTMHPLAEAEYRAQLDDPKLGSIVYTVQYVGFGDESTWRGKLYRKDGAILCVELLTNCDMKMEQIALATMGLAVLVRCASARLSDVVPN